MAAHNPMQGRTLTPPSNLHQRKLPSMSFSGLLHRIHLSEYGPIYFGKNACFRFDDPDGEQGSFGTLYAATDEHGAFIETFGESEGNTVSQRGLSLRSISQLVLEKPLQLVDLTGSGLAHLGGAGEITAGAYSISQAWAKALFEHPEKPHGIYYRARHDQSRCSIALYHPQSSLLKVHKTTPLDDHHFAVTLGSILDEYRFALV